jgi:hypothetical protein
MAILNVRDALDYIRLCDGDENLRLAVEMVDGYYTGLKERHDALRESFATEVKNAYDNTLRDRDDEIVRLKEILEIATWRISRMRDVSYDLPEDEDDT